MSLQHSRASAPEASWVHRCDACSGPMRIVMATPSVRNGGERFYQCDYVCDCGYRQIFDQEF
jgi:hypothetical protein